MIVSCGEALVDLVPEPVPGGGPMNVAIAAARLGAPSAFLGRISTDASGDAIWDYLRVNHVDLRLCERGPEATARAIVELTPSVVFRFEGEGTADTQLAAADLGLLGAGPHVVHGGALGLFRGRTAETLASLAEGNDGIVSVDPNVRPQIIDDREQWDHFHDRWLGCGDLYKASDEDLDWIWPGRLPEDCASQLLEGNFEAVIVTHGADGATVYTNVGSIGVAGRPVHVVDTVGAGDTFVGSVLASLSDRGAVLPEQLEALSIHDWHLIATRAVVAASVTCSRRGANPPRLGEL